MALKISNNPSNSAAPLKAMVVLWALSGFSTLTFEFVWMREMAVWAGSTVTASALVVSVFFLCAAAGNLFGAQLLKANPRPLLLYARFEVLAATGAVISLIISRAVWDEVDVLPSGWPLRIGIAFLLAGPASFCSGVAFPCLAEAFVPEVSRRATIGGWFYGWNLLGAASGVVAGGVLLPSALGLQAGFVIAAITQAGGGLLAWKISRSFRPALRSKHDSPAPGERINSGWLLLGCSGALSLAAQSLLILWARQIFEGSVYAVGGVLGAFIVGLGLGALAAGALRRRSMSCASLLRGFAAASAALLFILPIWAVPLSTSELVLTAKTPAGLMFQSLYWCICALLPLSFSLGGIFPVAWEMTGASAAGEGNVVGRALATNKIGAAVGTALALFALMPLCDLVHGTIAIAWCYGLIALLVRKRSWHFLLLLVPALWQTFCAQPLPGITPELRIIATTAGSYGPVSVVEDKQTRSRQILLNSRQRLSGTQRALSSQRHQSWVPLLFCRQPRRVYTIGMAAGISAAAALDFPLENLDAVELVPEVVNAAREHFSEWNAPLFSDPRARVFVDDGRVNLAQSESRYDAIICDLLFPAEEGTAYLYSKEFFALASARLYPAGIFCLWLPCYQHTPATADMVIRTFLEVFPHAVMVRASFDPLQPVVGLVGSNQKLPVSVAHLEQQLSTVSLHAKSVFFRSAAHAQMLLVGDLHAARPGFSEALMTTDDHPHFAFIGPRMPGAGERLHGIPFLNWAGRRFLEPNFPSCDLGDSSAAQLLQAIRAANHYHAAAVAATVLPGDQRPAAARDQQVSLALQRARELSPATPLDVKDLGH